MRNFLIIIILLGFLGLGLIDITHGRIGTGFAAMFIALGNALLFLQ